jgi:hypothetical protein
MKDDASVPRDQAFTPKRNHGFLTVIGLPQLGARACGSDQSKPRSDTPSTTLEADHSPLASFIPAILLGIPAATAHTPLAILIRYASLSARIRDQAHHLVTSTSTAFSAEIAGLPPTGGIAPIRRKNGGPLPRRLLQPSVWSGQAAFAVA